MTDSITLFKPLDERVEHIENVLFHGASTLKLQVRQIRATKLGASIIQTAFKAPYVKIDSDGVLIVNDLAGDAALRLKSYTPNTTTEIRECEGGIAISSDRADVVSFRLFDTAFSAGATNRRLNAEFTALSGGITLSDNADADTFRIYGVYSDGTTTVEGLDSGNLILKSASAQVTVANDLEPETDDTYYAGDFQKGWKGIIVKDTANSKWYSIRSTNGAVVIAEVAS